MPGKEEGQLLAGRVRDLAHRAMQNEYLTHTGFLSLSEQSRAAEALEPADRGVFCGGLPEADRRVLFFLPPWMEEETLLRQEESGEGEIACVKILVRGARFTKEIGHRDCLGALMHLGIGRDQVGDILLEKDGSCAYAFVLAGIAGHICRELVTVGRAHVDTQIVPPSVCTARPVLEPRSGSIASVRIDNLIAMVFHLSRSAAQQLIEREEVFADGRIVTAVSRAPHSGSRISVRGYGKFIYEGEEKTTKKGRIFVKTSVYR